MYLVGGHGAALQIVNFPPPLVTDDPEVRGFLRGGRVAHVHRPCYAHGQHNEAYDTNAFTLSPASPQAAAISQLFVGTLIFLAAILVLVTVLIIFAVIRYRDRPGAP